MGIKHFGRCQRSDVLHSGEPPCLIPLPRDTETCKIMCVQIRKDLLLWNISNFAPIPLRFVLTQILRAYVKSDVFF